MSRATTKGTGGGGTAVGLRQAAERAGISVATAPAVLSPTRSNTRVSAQTRERVLSLARELHYHPNALARALTGQPTKTLGVLFGLERASVAGNLPSFVAGPHAHRAPDGRPHFTQRNRAARRLFVSDGQWRA